jgi:hypothetical protein
MRKKQFSVEQMIGVSKQAEVGDLLPRSEPPVPNYDRLSREWDEK